MEAKKNKCIYCCKELEKFECENCLNLNNPIWNKDLRIKIHERIKNGKKMYLLQENNN